MKYIARKTASNVNVAPTSPLKEFFILTGALLTIVLVLYAAMGLAVDFIVPRLSVGFEEKMGRLFVMQLETSPSLAKKSAQLQAMVEGLQHRCIRLPYAVTVHLEKNDAINAVALPGGHIVVFTGLLEKMTSENELAFVLAHEMGHFAHRDHLRGLGRGLVLAVLSVFLFGPDSHAADLTAGAMGLKTLHFSRQQESRADAFALQALNCRYGHVAGAKDFFSKIPAGMDPGRYGHYFSSHPETQRRIEAITRLARKHGYTFGKPKPIERLTPSP